MNHDSEATLDAIAARTLGVGTLDERGRDSLDFHDCSVVGIREALAEAFEAGRSAAPAPVQLGPEVLAGMWCDLMLTELQARGAQHAVTGRAINYLAGGLPLDRVLDALKIEAAGWDERLAAYDDWQEANRVASAGLRFTRDEVEA